MYEKFLKISGAVVLLLALVVLIVGINACNVAQEAMSEAYNLRILGYADANLRRLVEADKVNAMELIESDDPAVRGVLSDTVYADEIIALLRGATFQSTQPQIAAEEPTFTVALAVDVEDAGTVYTLSVHNGQLRVRVESANELLSHVDEYYLTTALPELAELFAEIAHGGAVAPAS